MLEFIIFCAVLFLYRTLWRPKDCDHFYKTQPLFFAHRGAIHREPENTIRSFLAAVSAGLPAIEMDVMSTQDGAVVCSHNFDLERKTSGDGMIHELTFNDLKTQADEIPALEEVLRTIPEHIILNIEIKTRRLWDIKTTKETVRLIKKFNRTKTTILSSFNPLIILLAGILDRRIYTAFIVWDKKWMWLTDWIHPDLLHPEFGLVTTDLLRFANNKNMRLNVWTVNSKPAIELLKSIGIDGIITDRMIFCKS
jgi:glycerophosphoryl diester phosphodiesterase